MRVFLYGQKRQADTADMVLRLARTDTELDGLDRSQLVDHARTLMARNPGNADKLQRALGAHTAMLRETVREIWEDERFPREGRLRLSGQDHTRVNDMYAEEEEAEVQNVMEALYPGDPSNANFKTRADLVALFDLQRQFKAS